MFTPAARETTVSSKDKGVVHSPDPKDSAGDELIGSVVEAVERAKKIG